jgi:branched-chain amino acid transport system ATP-binding protein
MTVCGNPRAAAGSIRFEGQELTGLATHQIMHLGLAQSPEGRRIFPRMTVYENLQIGAILNLKRDETFDEDVRRAYELFPILKKRESQRAGTMSGGEQQMLAVGRALMMRPRLMLLDEPSFGLAPNLTEELFDILGAINKERRVSMLVVEQNASLALAIADHAYLLETGRIVISGTAKEIEQDETVRKAYLGY